MKKRLAIITTHPIQYNAPMFKLLANRKNIEIKVFYTWSQTSEKKYDPEFDRDIEWDIPLLDGYEFEFVNNISKNPGSKHFFGIDNPLLNNKISAWQPNAILIYGWRFKSHLKTMWHFYKKIPVFFRGDSTILDKESFAKSIIKKIILKLIYKLTTKCFYTGIANKEYFLKNGVKPDKLVFVPHAIDNDRFACKTDSDIEKAISLKSKLELTNKFVVLFTGKFNYKKNPVLLLQVARYFIDKDNFRFLFVGNGELETCLKQQAANLPNVKFLPFQNQSVMPVIYQSADVLVLPSAGPGETWGLVVNEAMSCGKPVIVSDKCGCYKDLVHENKNGFIFESGNLDQLTNYLYLLSKSDLTKFSEKSLEIIRNYSFEKVCEAIEKSVSDISRN